MIRLCQGLETSFDILTEVSNLFEEIWMASLLVGLMISESIHRNFGVTAVFRFHLNYVNYTLSMIFWAVVTKALVGRGRRK
jgi:hypothetical protein